MIDYKKFSGYKQCKKTELYKAYLIAKVYTRTHSNRPSLTRR